MNRAKTLYSHNNKMHEVKGFLIVMARDKNLFNNTPTNLTIVLHTKNPNELHNA